MLGTYDSKPVLNSIIYDVLFPDGVVKQYSANTIAQSLYSTLDSEGYSKSVLDCILEHSKDDRAIDKANTHIHTKRETDAYVRLQYVGYFLFGGKISLNLGSH